MMVNKLVIAIFLVALAVGSIEGRHRRHLDSWLTAEQKEQLKDLSHSSQEYKTKVSEFYAVLPEDQKLKWDKVYEDKCFDWTSRVQSQDKESDFRELLASKNVEAVEERINELKQELGSEHRQLVDLWMKECLELVKKGVSARNRRNVNADNVVKDFIGWMSPEQLLKIKDLKAAGTAEDEIKATVKGFFNELPAEQQATLKEEFKGKCRTYFKPLLTDEESEKIKSLAGSDKAAAGALIKGVVDRQTGDVKVTATKMFSLCGEVYKDASRKRREIDNTIKEFLGWLKADQLAKIGELKAAGKSEEEIKTTVKGFFNELPAEQQTSLKEEFKGKCKVFFGPLLNEDEKAKIETLKNDKPAAGALIQGVVERQTGDAKVTAQKMFTFCGEVFKDASRKRREIDSAFKDFLGWLKPEQVAKIGELKAAGKSEEEIKTTVKGFFNELPAEQQTSLKEEFKGKCKTYFKPLLTDEESEKIKLLAGSDKAAAGALIKGVVDRQTEVYKDASRKRREIDSAFKDFLGWLKPEQVAKIGELKSAGKSEEEIKTTVKGFFNELPAEQQSTLKEEFKGKCKVFFGPLLNEDEKAKIETLKNDKPAAGALIQGVVERQTGDAKVTAQKMFTFCGEVFKDASRKRREIDSAFKDFLGWLKPEQVAQIGELKAAGKSEEEIKTTVKGFFNELPAQQQSTLKEEFKGKCRTYFKPLLTDEESEKIKSLAGSDKAAAGALIKGVVDRQTGDVKVTATKMFSLCGEVYKDASRKRREIDSAFKDFLGWLKPEQVAKIGELKSAGKSEEEIKTTVKGFFNELPAEQQSTLKEEFKGKCKVFFGPFLNEDEKAKIETLKNDKPAAGALIQGVVERQTGDAKVTAQKMFTLCGEVFKDASRKRREIDSAFKDFLGWLKPEQVAKIGELKAAGKSEEEIKTTVKGFFNELPAEQQTTLKEEFKGKCRTYFKPLLTDEESEKIKLLAGSDKAAAGALIKGVVDRQTGDVKVTATKMFSLCGEVYKDASRKRREIDSAFKDFLGWLKPEQVAKIGELKYAGKSEEEIKTVVKGYFNELPTEQQSTLKEEFKGKCKVFFGPLLNEDEKAKIETLKNDKPAAGALIQGVVERQTGDAKVTAQKMFTLCGEVFKDASRKRREIDSAFKDFLGWLKPEQVAKIGELKSAGKSEEEIKTTVKGFFNELPAEQQSTLKEEFKGKCKVFFGPLLNEDEKAKIETLKNDKPAAGALIKGVVDRQTGDVKVTANKMFSLCGEVYKDSSRKMRRDVRQKIEKHLAWLRPEEKETIIQMTNEGKSKEEIKSKLYEFITAHEKDSSQKEKTIKNCYAWMDEVATKEEIENLHKLHHIDHGACKGKVREFISRLSVEKQKAVEASLPFCEKLWYGSHDEHTGHNHDSGDNHEGHQHHGHHHRKRRHLTVLSKYIEWMSEKQQREIQKMEKEGIEFTQISEKIREYFKQLPEDRQNQLKATFKDRCLTWAKEVSLPKEWAEIKKYYSEKEWKLLKEKLVELEERLTENQKHTIEHVRGVCYRLWSIPHEKLF
ncbi:unnamed protein product [Caenorhabditis angaria]|uniref:Polyprotein allergen nematode domain-containing protein n=1 Tax=Caenorhabditis angaria TaxID=860376 RepID=A0A9P1IXQ2_9PELO|nr:unnamed protein product [Caenorhabditis angaria]